MPESHHRQETQGCDRSVEELYQRLQRFAKEHATHLSRAERTWLRQAPGEIELCLIKVSSALAPGGRPSSQDTGS
jgi:predicted ATPase